MAYRFQPTTELADITLTPETRMLNKSDPTDLTALYDAFDELQTDEEAAEFYDSLEHFDSDQKQARLYSPTTTETRGATAASSPTYETPTPRPWATSKTDTENLRRQPCMMDHKGRDDDLLGALGAFKGRLSSPSPRPQTNRPIVQASLTAFRRTAEDETGDEGWDEEDDIKERGQDLAALYDALNEPNKDEPSTLRPWATGNTDNDTDGATVPRPESRRQLDGRPRLRAPEYEDALIPDDQRPELPGLGMTNHVPDLATMYDMFDEPEDDPDEDRTYSDNDTTDPTAKSNSDRLLDKESDGENPLSRNDNWEGAPSYKHETWDGLPSYEDDEDDEDWGDTRYGFAYWTQRLTDPYHLDDDHDEPGSGYSSPRTPFSQRQSATNNTTEPSTAARSTATLQDEAPVVVPAGGDALPPSFPSHDHGATPFTDRADSLSCDHRTDRERTPRASACKESFITDDRDLRHARRLKTLYNSDELNDQEISELYTLLGFDTDNDPSALEGGDNARPLKNGKYSRNYDGGEAQEFDEQGRAEPLSNKEHGEYASEEVELDPHDLERAHGLAPLPNPCHLANKPQNHDHADSAVQPAQKSQLAGDTLSTPRSCVELDDFLDLDINNDGSYEPKQFGSGARRSRDAHTPGARRPQPRKHPATPADPDEISPRLGGHADGTNNGADGTRPHHSTNNPADSRHYEGEADLEQDAEETPTRQERENLDRESIRRSPPRPIELHRRKTDQRSTEYGPSTRHGESTPA
ncbi:hypothetical protein EDB84DRAFT_1570303 [Lactarius hengduanensis]|nr:hypothetical protein EDB84DRAFT_1570303 [Lactarius hengduanensis]